MAYYHAFGFLIQSDTDLPHLLPADNCEGEPDVIVRQANLDQYHNILPEGVTTLLRNNAVYFETPIGQFLVSDGRTIEYEPAGSIPAAHMGAYFMGHCMGGILHQRGLYPIHCSCVADDKRAVIICGDSGAGKSTLAAEFLNNGWKLLTDDVAAIDNIHTIPTVSPSFPSQKLWPHSMDAYGLEKDRVHAFYEREEGLKYGVDVTDKFLNEPRPLSLIVWLVPVDDRCSLTTLSGMEKIDLLMYNTYNSFMLPKEDHSKLFRHRVALSTKVPMVRVHRQNGINTAKQLFDMITNYLEE